LPLGLTAPAVRWEFVDGAAGRFDDVRSGVAEIQEGVPVDTVQNDTCGGRYKKKKETERIHLFLSYEIPRTWHWSSQILFPLFHRH
jgi:hypothetical protein